jgi:hypothetical protein
MKRIISALALLLPFTLNAQNTLGLMQNNPGNMEGYVLFAPNSSDTTYLIDKCGYRIHEWPSTHPPGLSVYLMDDGSILRTGRAVPSSFSAGGQGGIIERIDWNGNITWSFKISNTVQCQHHDIYPMANGNILAIVWDLKSPAEAKAAGRDTTHIGVSLWSEKIVELQPLGLDSAVIVWQWNLWDHLVQSYDATKPNYGVVSDHPELVNLNYFTGSATSTDWQHCNAIDYDEALDQIILSCHNFGEFWILDHGTSTAEAASHNGGRYGKGGDLLYRWGNPQTYGRGTAANKQLFGQHNVHRVRSGLKDAGSILLFNNGLNRPSGNYSSVELIALPMDSTGAFAVPLTAAYSPDSAYWKYPDAVPTNFYSSNISGAQRLENGNTLICSGQSGLFFEIDSMKNTVWKYICPTSQGGVVLSQGATPIGNPVFRCREYMVNDPAFAGRVLTPGPPVELNPIAYACSMLTGMTGIDSDSKSIRLLNYGNGHYAFTWTGASDQLQLKLYDVSGREAGMDQVLTINNDQPVEFELPTFLGHGLYILKAMTGTSSWEYKVVH